MVKVSFFDMAIVDLGKDVLELANFLCHFNGQPKKSLAVAIFDPQRKRPSYAAAGTENVFSMAAASAAASYVRKFAK